MDGEPRALATNRKKVKALNERERPRMRIYQLSSTVPPMAVRVVEKMRVPLRRLCVYLGKKSLVLGACLAIPFMEGHAYTVVTLSTSAPAGLEKAFIMATTTHFRVEFKANPLAANTYTIKLLGVGEPQTVLGNSLTECIAQGFADGQENERSETIKYLRDQKVVDFDNWTCANLPVSSIISDDCQKVYDLVTDELNRRSQQIYSSTGAVVFQ